MSPRTGDFEGGWGLVYITLKYYGFDKAAADFTTDIIEKVHACPFSAADKTDFDRWIAAAQIEVQTSLDEATSHGLPPPAQRLDMQGGDPTRQDTSKLVNQIEQHPETITAAPCVIGSGPDL